MEHQLGTISTDPDPADVSDRAAKCAIVRGVVTESSEAYERSNVLREPPEDLTVVTMLEALELVGTERVLEIGSPTSYTAAVLSHLAAEVYSGAAEEAVAERRARELSTLGCRNVHVALAAPQAG